MTEPINPIGRVTGYRELSEGDIAKMNEVKAAYQTVVDLLGDMMTATVGERDANGAHIYDPRCIAIAKTEAQTSAMWAVRAITQPEGP